MCLKREAYIYGHECEAGVTAPPPKKAEAAADDDPCPSAPEKAMAVGRHCQMIVIGGYLPVVQSSTRNDLLVDVWVCERAGEHVIE